MLQLGQEWIVYDTPFKLMEVATAPTGGELISDVVHLYAKDKSGAATLYWKSDAGVEYDLSAIGNTAIGNSVTGGTAGSILFIGSGPVLAQDNANLFYDDTNNRLGLGVTAPILTMHIADAGSVTAGILVDSITSASAPQFIGRGARTSFSSPSAVQADDTLALLGGRGYGSTGYSSAVKAAISLRAAESWTDSAQGTYFSFFTTATGGTSLSEKVRIDSAGGLYIKDGITAPSTASGFAILYVDSSDGDLKVKFGDGTVKTIVVDT